MELVRLGEECTKKVSKIIQSSKLKTQKSIGNIRKLIKAELAEEIKEIDGVVEGLGCFLL